MNTNTSLFICSLWCQQIPTMIVQSECPFFFPSKSKICAGNDELNRKFHKIIPKWLLCSPWNQNVSYLILLLTNFRISFVFVFISRWTIGSEKNPFRIIGTELSNQSTSIQPDQQRQPIHTFTSESASLGSSSVEGFAPDKREQYQIPTTNASVCTFRKPTHSQSQPNQVEQREIPTHKILFNQISAPSYFNPIKSYTVKTNHIYIFMRASTTLSPRRTNSIIEFVYLFFILLFPSFSKLFFIRLTVPFIPLSNWPFSIFLS